MPGLPGLRGLPGLPQAKGKPKATDKEKNKALRLRKATGSGEQLSAVDAAWQVEYVRNLGRVSRRAADGRESKKRRAAGGAGSAAADGSGEEEAARLQVLARAPEGDLGRRRRGPVICMGVGTAQGGSFGDPSFAWAWGRCDAGGVLGASLLTARVVVLDD